MGRSTSRELAMKLLYQLEIQKEDKDDQLCNILEENGLAGRDREYFLDVVNGTLNNLSDIDKTITKYAKSWKLNRIPKVDLSILRLCIYETVYREDIPFSVSINEAVELAKKYSGEDASAFINGIMGKISRLKVVSTEKRQSEE